MASTNLIQGAGAVAKSQGFVNYAEAINVPNPTQGANFYALERQRKEETKSRVNGYIDQLKSDIDLDGLTAEQQSSLRGFLVSERNKYAYAASEIAKIDDATDPEYQHYVDIMNGVNRSFQTLSNELKSYKDAKKSYVETHQADLYSNAASADEVQIAASLYGLDPEVPAEFGVGEGGHIKFNVGGVEQSYEDYKEPMLKDFKTMNALLTTTNEIYNAGNKLNDTKIQLLGTQVEAMLADPKSIQSILSGDFAGNGIDLSGIAYNPNDIAGTRIQVKDAIMNALVDVANEGYAEKERKRNRGRNNPSRPSDPLDPSSPPKGKDYSERWKDVNKYPDQEFTIKGRKVQKWDINQIPEDERTDRHKILVQTGNDFYLVNGVLHTAEETEDILNN